MNEDAHYQLLKILEKHLRATQRELAREWGVSVGQGKLMPEGPHRKGLGEEIEQLRSEHAALVTTVLETTSID
jgi:hypothetical protein